MATREELLALALRCETEKSSIELDHAIVQAVDPVMRGRNKHDSLMFRPTSILDDIKYLEPRDAQEICVRKYPKGAYIRITLKSGTPVYCEVLDRPITEVMARCSAALKAMAEEMK